MRVGVCLTDSTSSWKRKQVRFPVWMLELTGSDCGQVFPYVCFYYLLPFIDELNPKLLTSASVNAIWISTELLDLD